jgi:hypothetical protein
LAIIEDRRQAPVPSASRHSLTPPDSDLDNDGGEIRRPGWRMLIGLLSYDCAAITAHRCRTLFGGVMFGIRARQTMIWCGH